MRASVIVPLMLAALFGLGLRYGSSHSGTSQPQRRGDRVAAQTPTAPKPSAKVEVKTPPWSGTVTGWPHKDEKDARNSALQKAGERVSECYLKTLNPPIDWVPTPDFIRDDKYKIVTNESTERQTIKDDPNAPPMTSVTLNLEISDSTLKAIQEQDRHYRVEQRLWFLGRGLGGLVLLLGAIAGAIRLDEWTKGYFPLPLKLGLVVLAAAGAAALWVV